MFPNIYIWQSITHAMGNTNKYFIVIITCSKKSEQIPLNKPEIISKERECVSLFQN